MEDEDEVLLEEVVVVSEEVSLVLFELFKTYPDDVDRLLMPDFPPTPPRVGRDPAIQARENIIFLADQEVSSVCPAPIRLLKYADRTVLSL